MTKILETPVKDVKVGDFLELQGDAYADPKKDNTVYEFEYCLVEEIEQETISCICLYFDNSNPVGFPPDHLVKVVQL